MAGAKARAEALAANTTLTSLTLSKQCMAAHLLHAFT
jgi:hypothetical protein